jgi:ABC-type spermidine/putrescine transport system permease subunit I
LKTWEWLGDEANFRRSKKQLTIYIDALLRAITIAVYTTVDSLVCSVNVGYGESISIDRVFGEGCV